MTALGLRFKHRAVDVKLSLEHTKAQDTGIWQNTTTVGTQSFTADYKNNVWCYYPMTQMLMKDSGATLRNLWYTAQIPPQSLSNFFGARLWMTDGSAQSYTCIQNGQAYFLPITNFGVNDPVFGSSGVVGYHDVPLVTGPGIVVGRKGNVGSVFWSEDDFYPIDTAYFVISKIPLRFLYYDLQTKNFLNNDAAVPGLNRNQAYSLETVMPPTDILTRFCQFAGDFEQMAAVLRLKNSSLRRTRDLLLPKLISGEVDVSELEIILPEEAAV